jgi:hypothetical protein
MITPVKPKAARATSIMLMLALGSGTTSMSFGTIGSAGGGGCNIMGLDSGLSLL